MSYLKISLLVFMLVFSVFIALEKKYIPITSEAYYARWIDVSNANAHNEESQADAIRHYEDKFIERNDGFYQIQYNFRTGAYCFLLTMLLGVVIFEKKNDTKK